MSDEIFIDGGCRPNPGTMTIAIVVDKYDDTGNSDIVKKVGKGTSNRAEYIALITALKMVQEKENVVIFTDSQLIYGQMTKNWRVKKNKDLYKKAKLLFNSDTMKIVQIPREENRAGWILDRL